MALFDRFTKSSNPVLSEERLNKAANQTLDGGLVRTGEPMTVGGAVNKS